MRKRARVLCENCGCNAVKNEPEETNATVIARALGDGPKHLGELAKAVYGIDQHATRRRISASLKHSMIGMVESVDGKGTWRLVGVNGRLRSVNDCVAEMFRVFT